MNTTNTTIHPLVAVLTLLASFVSVSAQSTAFTYQGHLQEDGVSVYGLYDLRFTLYAAAGGGSPVAGPVTNSPVAVSNGLFTVTLDFGLGVFPGEDRWLEIGVRTHGGVVAFTPLSPRQALSPNPYALHARSVEATNIAGIVPNSHLPANLVRTDPGVVEMEAEFIFRGPVEFQNASGPPFVLTGSQELVPGLNADMLGNRTARGFWQTEGNAGTTAGTDFLGTTDDRPLEFKVNGQRALRLVATTNTPNVIGGASNNIVDAGVIGATIGGGGSLASPRHSGGPVPHHVYSDFATIGGGIGNVARGEFTTVGGGIQNLIGFWTDFFEGDSEYSTIAGGQLNFIDSSNSTIGGGAGNIVRGRESVVAGGAGNSIHEWARGSAIAGGECNEIKTNGSFDWVTVGVLTNVLAGSIGGGVSNSVLAAAATIGGGFANTTSGNYATIAGGEENNIGINSEHSAIAGGKSNVIQSNATQSIIGGGYFNFISAATRNAMIGGGLANTNIWGWSATISGGEWNQIERGHGATIGGGGANSITTYADYSVIPGGYQNRVRGYFGFAAGRRAKADHDGAFVWADDTDADFASTTRNQFNIRATGGVRIDTGTGPGVTLNAVDRPLITRGHNPFTSGNNQGAGRWGLFMESHALVVGMPALPGNYVQIAKYNEDSTRTSLMILDQAGNMSISGTYSPSSDRNAKENFSAVNPGEVLEKIAALPISCWNFKQDPNAEHVGPMAQDFHAAFGLGTDDKHIATVDADGVALAAIQGLNEKVEVRSQNAEARIQSLEAENAALKARLERLEQRLGASAGIMR